MNLSGPDAGYIATSGCILSCALTMIYDRDHMPTKLASNILKMAIHFSQIKILLYYSKDIYVFYLPLLYILSIGLEFTLLLLRSKIPAFMNVLKNLELLSVLIRVLRFKFK